MKSLLVSSTLAVLFCCPAFAVDIPAPADPASVCTPGQTITLASAPDKLKQANDTVVTVVLPDDPAILGALGAIGISPTDVPPGLKEIVGYVIDQTASGGYFAHPFDKGCVLDQGLPLLPDYKPTSAHGHIDPPLGAPSVLPFSGVPAIPEVTQPQTKIFDNHA